MFCLMTSRSSVLIERGLFDAQGAAAIAIALCTWRCSTEQHPALPNQASLGMPVPRGNVRAPNAQLRAAQMAGEAEGLLGCPGAPCDALIALPLLPPLLCAPALRAAVISAPLLAGVAALLSAAAAAAEAVPEDAMASLLACCICALSAYCKLAMHMNASPAMG